MKVVISTVRLGRLKVPLTRIGFVTEMIIRCYEFGFSQADKV